MTRSLPIKDACPNPGRWRARRAGEALLSDIATHLTAFLAVAAGLSIFLGLYGVLHAGDAPDPAFTRRRSLIVLFVGVGLGLIATPLLLLTRL